MRVNRSWAIIPAALITAAAPADNFAAHIDTTKPFHVQAGSLVCKNRAGYDAYLQSGRGKTPSSNSCFLLDRDTPAFLLEGGDPGNVTISIKVDNNPTRAVVSRRDLANDPVPPG